ncbi:FtsK/SpoIIIE family DNA translocase [Microvirga thermotolerans]|uniref:DNA translocase FtsK n=1 Tax=Microvirga thermotolerans TaxID=2651334 RepID=A0A5P9JU58_9HYPH|nr:DNA translocase FtsK [Microvirga thermotolerans]QFU14990.1 cell division protein FtsK [Microvirga thermotolerans]
MRTARRSSSAYDGLSSALRAFVARRAQEMIGLCLLVLAGAVAAALATWSVDDPSLNNATDAPVRNLLGWPGAIVADLLMQLLGLGSIAALLPLALWGWRQMKSGHLGRAQLRLALWIIGTGAATALASALPATDRWPLPTGLGGVVGDAILAAGKAVTGLSSGSGSAVLGLVFAAVAILSLSAAGGLGLSEERHREELDDLDEPAAPRRGRGRAAEWDEAEDPGRDEPGWGIVSLGALAHGFMSLRAAARRWAEKRAAAGLGEEAAVPAGGTARRGAPDAIWTRREPILDDAPRRPKPAPAAAPLHDEDDEGWDEAPPPGPGRAAPEPPPSRVAPVPAAPKPGKRIVREAQPSFLDEGEYQLPPLGLLAEPKKPQAPAISADALEQNAALLEGTLEDFGVKGEIINVRPGPVVTLYELEPAPGTKSSRVISLADDIARSMSAVSARVAVVQGRNAIGIELPNHKRETVFLRELLASHDFETTKQKLALCLGKTIGGEPVIADLARMPHLLVAGTTGSGKSVAINTMILSLVYRLKPEECRLIMVDPKMLELSVYDGIPHLLTPVVTDPKKAVVALKWAVREMEDRYKKMSKLGVRNIDGFNARVSEAKARGEVITRTVQTGFDRETGQAVYEDEAMDLEPLPYIVVIVDEMADLMMVAGKEIEGAIQRLAQMARAAGIHVILATQRPSVDVITGTIKANFPTRISFQVTSKIDSRTILGEMGAEQLLGQGDMLYMAGGGRITRVHGPFCSDEEVEKVVAHLKRQGRPQYLEAVTADEDEGGAGGDSPVFDQGEFGAPGGDLYEQAVAVVLRDKKASTSYIQRRLQIGYNRAASLMERMEKEGIVGPANHAGKREILLETPDMGDE